MLVVKEGSSFCKCGGFEKSRLELKEKVKSLFAAGVFGHGLGSLADGVLAELSRQVEADGRLDLAAGDGVLLVVVSQARGLGGDALEDVIHEGVHDAHGLAGDASVRVHLLQDLVDVDGVALAARSSPLAVAGALGLGGSSFSAFSGGHFAWHGCSESFFFFAERIRRENACRNAEKSEENAGGRSIYILAWDHFGGSKCN